MRTRTVLTCLTALLAAVAMTWVPAVIAQQAPPPTPPAPSAPPPSMGAEKQIEGQVKAVDPAGKTLTLSDDTKFMIPASLKVSRTELKPGAMVKVSYEEKGGQRVVTRLEVMQ